VFPIFCIFTTRTKAENPRKMKTPLSVWVSFSSMAWTRTNLSIIMITAGAALTGALRTFFENLS